MDDLIRRSDAIEAVEEVDWYHQNRNKDMVSGANDAEHQAWYKADDVYKALKAVPSADRPQEWIPCSERLPSNFGEVETVLATTDVDGDKVIVMFALDVKSFYLKGYVSAWMPLPKPYGEREDE